MSKTYKVLLHKKCRRKIIYTGNNFTSKLNHSKPETKYYIFYMNQCIIII